MSYGWHDVLGNIGVLLVLGTYLLLQLERIAANAIPYSLVNAVGAALIIVSLTQDFNLSAFVIETAWLIISVYGVARSLSARRA